MSSPYKVISLDTVNAAKSKVPLVPAKVETDEEVLLRIQMQFEILTEMTKAAKRGDIRAMIVAGTAGVGKSVGIDNVIQQYNTFEDIGDKVRSCELVKGTISAVVLYSKLYEYRHKKCLVVFDDADKVWQEEESLNILKHVLDTGDRRIVSYAKDSRFLADKGIPNSFEFEGSCIIITNSNLENVSKKQLPHVKALFSRCHFLDVSLDTVQERMVWIKHRIDQGMLDSYGFDESSIAEIVEFIEDNKDRMKDLSLRTAKKLADLKKSMPALWRQVGLLSR
jgi:replicative DNA helicase